MWIVICVASVGGCYLLVYGVIRYYAPVPRLRRSVVTTVRQHRRLEPAQADIVAAWGGMAGALLADSPDPELLAQITQGVAVLQAYQCALQHGSAAQPADAAQLTAVLTTAITHLQTFQQQQHDRVFAAFHQEAAELAATLDVH